MIRMNGVQNASPAIDFVVTWVDGSDPEWRASYARYQPDEDTSPRTNGEERYRDWGSIKYFFRSVAQYAPWVNKVHFVTCGQLPDWLDTSCSKLNIVRHEDFIPAEYLPTFNSNTIELNIHRIPDLAENFVLFNDDMLLLNRVTEADFFRNGLPRITAALSAFEIRRSDRFYVPINTIAVLNDHFSPRACVKEHPFKWLCPQYGNRAIQTLLMLIYPTFRGLYESHLPQAYLKSTLEEIWTVEGAELERTCNHRFRGTHDVSHWLAKGWQCAKGEFYPCPVSWGRAFFFNSEQEATIAAAVNYINDRKGKAICLNDGKMPPEEFERAIEAILRSLNTVFPVKSEFEL